MIRRGIETADGEAGCCLHCDRQMPDGPDACVGPLDGVAEACCGHGWTTSPYVLFEDGRRLEARQAIRWFGTAGVGPPPVDTVTVQLLEQHDGQVAATLEYEYESLRVLSTRWWNDTDAEPVWGFDGTTVRLTRGAGVVPLPAGLVCTENPDGTVRLPVDQVGTAADGG